MRNKASEVEEKVAEEEHIERIDSSATTTGHRPPKINQENDE